MIWRAQMLGPVNKAGHGFPLQDSKWQTAHPQGSPVCGSVGVWSVGCTTQHLGSGTKGLHVQSTTCSQQALHCLQLYHTARPLLHCGPGLTVSIPPGATALITTPIVAVCRPTTSTGTRRPCNCTHIDAPQATVVSPHHTTAPLYALCQVLPSTVAATDIVMLCTTPWQRCPNARQPPQSPNESHQGTKSGWNQEKANEQRFSDYSRVVLVYVTVGQQSGDRK